MTATLRPMNLGEILDRTFQIYRKQFWAFVVVAAVPALVVHGRNDMLVPVADSVWLAEHLRDARLEIFEDTGHLAMLERPIRFNELVLDFVSN